MTERQALVLALSIFSSPQQCSVNNKVDERRAFPQAYSERRSIALSM